MSAIQQTLAAVAVSSGSGGISFLSVGAAGFSSSPVVALPPVHASGDLLVIAAAGSSSYTSPSGWSVGVNNTTHAKLCFWYKVDSGVETNVTLSGGGINSQAVMLAYRGTNATPLDVNGTLGSSVSASATTNSVTTVTNDALIVSVFAINANAVAFTGYPASVTVRYDGSSIANARALLVVDELQAALGASTARIATLVSDRWQTHAVGFKP